MQNTEYSVRMCLALKWCQSSGLELFFAAPYATLAYRYCRYVFANDHDHIITLILALIIYDHCQKG